MCAIVPNPNVLINKNAYEIVWKKHPHSKHISIASIIYPYLYPYGH